MGNIRIFFARSSFTGDDLNNDYDFSLSQITAANNAWGFGQVVALGLLVMPFVSFSGKSSSISSLSQLKIQ